MILAQYIPRAEYGFLYLVLAVVLVGAVPIVAALRSRAGMSNGVKLQLAAVGLGVLLLASAMVAIRYIKPFPRHGGDIGYRRDMTQHALITLVGSISIVQDINRTKAPLDASELWRWLADQDKSLQHVRFFDAERQMWAVLLRRAERQDDRRVLRDLQLEFAPGELGQEDAIDHGFASSHGGAAVDADGARMPIHAVRFE